MVPEMGSEPKKGRYIVKKVLLALLASFALLFGTPALTLAGDAPEGMPKVGEVIDAGYGCAKEDEAKVLAVAMSKGDEARDAFLASDANTSCGDASGRFMIAVVDYVEKVGDHWVIRVVTQYGQEGFAVRKEP